MVDKIRIADVVNNYEFTPPLHTHTQINNENSVIFLLWFHFNQQVLLVLGGTREAS